MLAAGTTLGPYEILGPLGSGGMGEVYRAKDPRLGRLVAVKVLPVDVADDPARLTRFEVEAKAVSALNHPNIVTLHEIGRGVTGPYLVLELVEGESLRTLLASGPLPLRKLLAIAAQVAAGLAKAHAAGIVHRDVKPENIMVSRDGFAKILDFGLARLVWPEAGFGSADQTATFVQHTATGVIMGTLGYLSPEQVSGEPADFRADQFALGALLYEMATGARPFARPTVVESLAATVQGEPEPLRTKRPDLPLPLEWLIERCLAKNPDDRYASTRDLARDLDELRTRLSEMSGMPSAGGPAPASRTSLVRRAAMAASAIAAALLLFVAGQRWSATHASVPSDWQGERLGVAAMGLQPVLSPDRHTVAFQAFVDGNTQVAVMKPGTAGWRVLTDDRTRGPIADLCWSADGTRIYFDRLFDVAKGIFSVSVFGEDVRPVLDDAVAPRALPDGTLLVIRLNANRERQIYRYRSDSTPARLEPLAAIVNSQLIDPAVQPFPDGREAAFYGHPAATPGALDHLYAIDLTSGRTRLLAPGLTMPEVGPGSWYPLATTDDRVFFVLPAGDVSRIVSEPRDGSDRLETVLNLPNNITFLQAGADGSLYTDQTVQLWELIRYSLSGNHTVKRTSLGSNAVSTTNGAAPLRDGRVLLSFGGQGGGRIMVLAPGKVPAPFVDTPDQTSAPIALLGGDRVALLLGTAPHVKIAIVSAADGRVVRLLKSVDGNTVTSLTGSPDGRELYYASAGQIWGVSADDGPPRKLHAGNAVAVDPHGQYFVVQVIEADEVRLVRIPLDGAAAQPISVSGAFKLAPIPFAPNAIGPDGRILVRVVSPDSWFWPTGLLDPRTGQIDAIAVANQADWAAGWTSEGDLLALAGSSMPSLWRFWQVARSPR